jgi:hypothetical protein
LIQTHFFTNVILVPVLSAHTVIEATEAVTRQVILEVARVEMIRQVENLQPKLHTIFSKSSRQAHTLQYLQIN